MLQAVDLSWKTPDEEQKLILDRINLSVKPGELTAVIGPSGGGKTTLLKNLCLLEAPSSGQVKIDDHIYPFPMDEDMPLNPKPWPKVTAVFQQLFLWPHLTLKENILLPVPNNANVEDKLSELIDLFDMAEFIDRYPNETSGGQKQRAAIARALILEPNYILLDEITSALDVEQAARVLKCLLELKKRNIGVLLITHQLNFAKQAADNIVFLADGKVLEEGGADLITKPKSARAKEFFKTVKLAL